MPRGMGWSYDPLPLVSPDKVQQSSFTRKVFRGCGDETPVTASLSGIFK